MTGDTAALTRARERLSAAIAAAEASEFSAATVRSALEIVGDLAAHRQLGEFGPAQEAFSAERIASALALASFDSGTLEDAAIAICEALDDLLETDSERAATEVALRALGTRDRFEYMLIGVERLRGAAPKLDFETAVALEEFAQIVRPELPRLTMLNEIRGALTAALAPEFRARFWWYSEASAVPEGAMASIAGVAGLVAIFPELEQRFRALVETERALRYRPRSQVVSLADWLARRRSGSGSGRLKAAAAADLQASELVVKDDYEISFRAPAAVVIDVGANLRQGELPLLRLVSGRTLRFEPVADALDRFRVDLDEEALAAERVFIVVPLERGDAEESLP